MLYIESTHIHLNMFDAFPRNVERERDRDRVCVTYIIIIKEILLLITNLSWNYKMESREYENVY